MRKGQDIKLNVAGQISCLLLVLLLGMAICPVAGSSAFAEEGTDETDEVTPAAETGTTEDNVTISFTPASGSASLTPTTAEGSLAKIDVVANVKIASTGGYSIYLGGENAALTGSKTGATIPAATTPATFNNMKTNTWGYAYAEGDTFLDAATYSALPQGQGKILATATGNQKNVNHNYALSFAAKIGNDKPADVYENQVTLSVTSSPLQATLSNINNMQEMETKVCSESVVGETKQLKGTRDGKYYWVTKLADDNCWMTQNLDLDLSTATALTPADSDVKSDWKPGFTTAASATAGTVNSGSQTETRSWSLGNYRIANPSSSSSCGSKKNDASQCSEQFEAYATPTSANGVEKAHYILGNHYQWNAATAGTGATITEGQATSSICPKGWRLPTGADNEEFKVLLDTYGVGTDVSKLTAAPLYFVRGGFVYQNTSLFAYAGDYGFYWSSTPGSSVNNAYFLHFKSTDSVDASSNSTRNTGRSIRCIAR